MSKIESGLGYDKTTTGILGRGVRFHRFSGVQIVSEPLKEGDNYLSVGGAMIDHNAAHDRLDMALKNI